MIATIITVTPLPTSAKSGPGQAPVNAQPRPKEGWFEDHLGRADRDSAEESGIRRSLCGWGSIKV